jgi:hypothetical protein
MQSFFYILAASDQLRKVIQLLETHNVTCSNLLLSLLQDPELQGQPCSNDLVDHASEILSAFHKHPGSFKSTFEWASNAMKACRVDPKRKTFPYFSHFLLLFCELPEMQFGTDGCKYLSEISPVTQQLIIID